MTLKKKFVNPLAIIIPVIALSIFLVPNADAQRKKGYRGGGGSGFSVNIGGGYNNYNRGYSNYNRGYSNYNRGYSSYNSYRPKTYTVSAYYNNCWNQSYCGTCAKTAYSTAAYYRNRGISVRY